MKKLAELIVHKRKLILIIFLVLAAAGAVLQSYTVINSNMTEYLPEDSKTKQGLGVMEEEFGSASTLNLMFTGLSEEEKEEVKETLEQMEYVDSVDYDAQSDSYNKDGHTRYVVNAKYDAYSDEVGALLAAVEAEYRDGYELAMGGTIIDGQKQGVDSMLILAALALLIVVLFIMCSSWLEPLLFLLAIGVAILLNAGTNILFPSVSQLTNSVAAILQLALSMDYSIMLIDRYRYERQQTTDKEAAMKQAITDGFASIASSSVTTIVGLLCLIFMSFTIGMDMGLVLAKGVFFSLISILFVLPSLILFFDKAIEKTKKKTPRFKMDGIAKFNYKFRYAIMVVFIAVFAVSFFLKGNAAVEFTAPSTNSDQDQIDEVFPSDNTVVLMYQNGDEDKIGGLISNLEELPGITGVSAYSNTLGKELTGAELAEEFDMGGEAADMLFYRYAGSDVTETLSVQEFLSFIETDVMENPDFSEYFDADTMEQFSQAAVFASKDQLELKRTGADMAEVLDMEQSMVYQLYSLYYSMNPAEGQLGLGTFLDFLSEDVMSNPELAAGISEAQKAQMASLTALSDPQELKKERTAEELSAQTGMDAALIGQLFAYASEAAGSEVTAMTLPDFLTFLTEDVATNPQFSAYLNTEALQQLGMMQQIVQAVLSEAEYTAPELAAFTGMDAGMVTQLFLYRQSLYGDVTGWELSVREFITLIGETVASGEADQGSMDEETLAQLGLAQQIMVSVSEERKYTPAELYELFGMEDADVTPESLSLLYLYYSSRQNADPDLRIALYDFVLFMDEEILGDESFSVFIDASLAKQLHDAVAELEEGKAALVGPNYSRMILQMDYDEESEETLAFIGDLDGMFQKELQGYYMIGNSPTSYEMQSTFASELNFITILTAIAIFIVVALTFRSLSVPIILVLLIQCAVFMTTAAAFLQGIGTYYLALIIVQAILMGATIDYAILYTEYYRKIRTRKNVRDSVISAYKGSIMTILTSSSILIGITLVVGLVVKDPTISQVCLTISKGSFFATLLVIFVLPALLVITDRFVVGKRKKSVEDTEESVN